MDELIDQFTNETGIQIEQQRILWPDLYAKLQVSVPAGEGPDLCLIHTVEVPHFASDGILDPMDAGRAGGEGLQGRGLPGVALAGRRLPGEALHGPARRAPAHPLPEREGHARRRPRRGGRQAQGARERRRAGGHGEADHQGRHVRLRDRHAEPRASTPGASITCSGRTARTCTRRTSSARRSASRRRSRRPSSGGVLRPAQGRAARRTRTPRDAFIAGKLGMWMAGSWNVTGLREAKVDFAVAPMPRLLKQPVVWTIPHQYSFPKPKAADPAKRDAGLGAHPLDDRPRRRVDAQGRTGLGVPQGPLRPADHGRPGAAARCSPRRRTGRWASRPRSGSPRRT